MLEEKVKELNMDEDRKGFTQEQEEQMEFFCGFFPCFWNHVDQDFEICSRKERYLRELSKRLRAKGKEQT